MHDVSVASIEETSSTEVADGVNPDAVIVPARLWRLSPFRDRDPAPPDYSDAGLDLFLYGDPNDDALEVVGVALTYNALNRNGIKRVADPDGNWTVYGEPSPQAYDSFGSAGASAGVPQGPAGSSGDVVATGIDASHSIANVGAYPILVRPTLTVVNARFETAQATMQASIDTDLAGAATSLLRDLWYGYGGSTSLKFPGVIVQSGDTYQFDAALQFTYRFDVADPFNYAVSGIQVGFDVIEITSTGV